MRFLRYVRLIPLLLWLLLRLGGVALGIGLAKRRALRVYENTLRREGLPEPFIAELVADYNLGFGELLRSGLAQIRVKAAKD